MRTCACCCLSHASDMLTPPQIPEDRFKEVKDLILSMTSTTSNRSGMPAIYGVVAAAEVERLRPLSELSVSSAQGEVCERVFLVEHVCWGGHTVMGCLRVLSPLSVSCHQSLKGKLCVGVCITFIHTLPYTLPMLSHAHRSVTWSWWLQRWPRQQQTWWHASVKSWTCVTRCVGVVG